MYELCKNNENLFNSFVNKIETDGNLFDSLAGAIRIIEDTANLILKPKNKFREIRDHKLSCKVYEAKYGSIRIYLFHEQKTGRVIVTGGLKGDQDEDIKSVIKIIKDYQDEK